MTHTENVQQLVLIVGAAGKTGRRVGARLVAAGVATRGVSRSTEPAFDWEDRTTWAPALAGVGAAYITFHPDLAVPGAATTVGDFAKEAVASGVRRLVLLSGRGEPEARQAERSVQDCGAEWTIVRCSWFAQNFDENYLLDAVLSGDVALPVDGVAEPFVDAGDIADVAVAALTQPGHAGQVYELTGPRLLTFGQAVHEIAQAAGRPVVFRSVTMAGYAATLAEYGVDPEVSWLLTYLFTEVLDGRNSSVTDGVQRALGRPPRDFGDYARAAAATGVWAEAGGAA